MKGELNKWKYWLHEGDYISFLICFIKNEVERQLSVQFHRQSSAKNCRTGAGTGCFMAWKEAMYGATFSFQASAYKSVGR